MSSHIPDEYLVYVEGYDQPSPLERATIYDHATANTEPWTGLILESSRQENRLRSDN